MTSVEVESVGCFAVEHEADWPGAFVFLLPHLARDEITMLKLINESLSLVVEK